MLKATIHKYFFNKVDIDFGNYYIKKSSNSNVFSVIEKQGDCIGEYCCLESAILRVFEVTE